MPRQVVSLRRDGDELEAEVVAEFDVVGGELVAAYYRPAFRTFLEREGIMVGGEILRPVDGLRFYMGLPQAFRRSTTLDVRDA